MPLGLQTSVLEVRKMESPPASRTHVNTLDFYPSLRIHLLGQIISNRRQGRHLARHPLLEIIGEL